jgi:hypothetical protein
MKTTIPLFSIVLAFFSVMISPQGRAVCQDACLANYNTVQGDNALLNLTGGFSNTAFGANALLSMTSASGNTAVGVDALYYDTTGYVNTAVGDFSLYLNTTGWANTAVGTGALQQNSTGVWNTAIGASALQDNTGSNNTATGWEALFFNTTGNNNTAMGSEAMGGNPDIQMTGSNNTALGYFALTYDTTGGNNTAMGANALTGNTSGCNNIALGYSAGVNLRTESNNIDVGNAGVADDSGFIRIGTTGTHTATFVAGIRETPITGAIPVGINANGQLGVRGSSARFKRDIKPIGRESEAIFALRPVSFRYREELDPNGEQQFGLVAEEVEKIDPELATRDANGKPYTVRYEAVNAMLLNEFLKEHKAFLKEQCKVEEQGAMIAQQQKQIDALTEGLQKVSAQLAVSKTAPATVLNNQ